MPEQMRNKYQTHGQDWSISRLETGVEQKRMVDLRSNEHKKKKFVNYRTDGKCFLAEYNTHN
jgi:hypothetical protein